jgi:hypothetical protein
MFAALIERELDLSTDVLGWALIAQCVEALLLARVAESERTRQEILASRRRFLDKAHRDCRG